MSTEATFAKSAVSAQEGRRWWLFAACVLVSLTNEVSTAVTNLSLGPMRRDREEWPRIAAEAITAPPLIMGLPRTDTGPAPNPEEIPPLVGHWSRQLPDL
jgi:hypothetical protein